MAEMTLFLQEAVRRFRFDPTGITPRMNPLVTLRPDSVLLNIRNR